MADTFTIGRTTQFGAETTHGVAPGAGATHQLVDMIVQMDPTFPVQEVRGTGRRFVNTVVPTGMEATAGKLSGGLGYNSWVYPISMAHGAATVTTPAGAINAKQWKWIIPLTGHVDPVSMDIEQGDSTDAEQFLWAILSAWGIDATRAGVAPSGAILARAINKTTASGGTFTGMTVAGVTQLPIMPVLPDHWSVYVDPTSANIGTTKITRAFHGKLDYGGIYVPFFPLDNALTSYGGTADGSQPKITFMVEEMKDPLVGEAQWVIARQGGTRRYIRFVAGGVGVSNLVDNIYQLNGQTAYTAGNVGFTYKGQAASWAFNATGAQIQTAIGALSTVGAANVSVTPSGTAFNTNTTFNVIFQGALQNDPTLPTITTQPTGGTVTITPVQIPYSMTYDLAGEIQLPGPNKDFQELRTREWTFTVVEDGAWGSGQALVITIVNGLTSGVL